MKKIIPIMQFHLQVAERFGSYFPCDSASWRGSAPQAWKVPTESKRKAVRKAWSDSVNS